MSDSIKAAIVITVGLILAAMLNGGIYQIVMAGAGSGGSQDLPGDVQITTYRLNRFTGGVVLIHGIYRRDTREQPSVTK